VKEARSVSGHAPGDTPGGRKLFTFEFAAVCLLVFLTYCNTTVFYSLDVYLAMLGYGSELRGMLIGASALSIIASYAFISPLMTPRRAGPCAVAGAAVLIACGAGFLAARSPLEILALRLAGGVGFSLLTASAMAVFVRIIPPERSGQAFGFYSVAGLLPFAVVPAAFEPFTATQASLSTGYMVMSLFLAPAMALMLLAGGRLARAASDRRERAVGFKDMLASLAHPPVAMALGMSSLYVLLFSCVYFFTKGLFLARGFGQVGGYFTIQMGCMIAVRLLGNRLFDRLDKTLIILSAFALTGSGCVIIALAQSVQAAYLSAVVMGLGMGVGAPALGSLMFTISSPRLKGVNANLSTMFQQMGNFLGPVLGAAATRALGEAGFLALGALAGLAGFVLCAVFKRRGMDRPAV
jgi:MFS family permease